MAGQEKDDWLAALIGGVIGGLFVVTLWLLRGFWVTLGWLALFVTALVLDGEGDSSWYPYSIGVLALLVILLVLSRRFGWLRRVLPVVAEFGARRRKRARAAGNRLLRSFGFAAVNDERLYRTSFRRGVWVIDAPLPALTDPKGVEASVMGRLALVEGAQSVRVQQTGPGGHYRIEFLDEVPRDPRAEMLPLDGPMPWSGDWAAVPYGLRADGSVATHKVRECSGTVVGGLPGGGKTAGLTALLSVLVPSPAVQFLVWDGKGGHDWGWMAPRASLYNRADDDRQRAALELEAVVAVMRQRLDQMIELRGGPSVWETGGPSKDVPLLVLIIDECQTYLDVTQVMKGDKEAAAFRDRTESAIASLVRKGRSVGIWVIPTTQKPTSDSLPTTIGANAASAVAFSVKTPDAEKAIIGTSPGPDDPTATALPPEPGYAVVASETGGREVVRFGYLRTETASALAHAHAGLRRDVIGPVVPDPDPAEEASPRTSGLSEDSSEPVRPARKRSPRRSRQAEAA